MTTEAEIQADLYESFRRLGMTEGEAREAARGRNHAALPLREATEAAYSASKTYGKGAVVTYKGLRYTSSMVGNVGMEPTVSPNWWTVDAEGPQSPSAPRGFTKTL